MARSQEAAPAPLLPEPPVALAPTRPSPGLDWRLPTPELLLWPWGFPEPSLFRLSFIRPRHAGAGDP